jgi:GT2 family glycosyltransferase
MPGTIQIYADDAMRRAQRVLASAPLAVPSLSSAGQGSSDQKPREGLSILILNKDAYDYLSELLPQIGKVGQSFEKRQRGFEVLIGDTGTTDQRVRDLYARLPSGFRVIDVGPYHFSSNNNVLAFQCSQYDHLLFLNNDISFEDPWLLLRMDDQLRHTDSHDQMFLGSQLLYPNGKVQHGGVAFLPHAKGGFFPYHLRLNQAPTWHKDPVEVPALTGAFLMVRSRDFALSGGYDLAFVDECQDIDLCLKLRRLGLSAGLISETSVVHHENGTRRKGEENWMDRSLFARKWQSFLLCHKGLIS